MIYFWKINQLKSDLANKGLPRWQVLIYLACILFVQIASLTFIGEIEDAPNICDNIDSAVFIVFLIVGTTYCYYANGGPKGKAFADRYVSLAWVFGIRYAVIVVLPSVFALYMMLSLFAELPDKTQWYDVILIGLLKLPFYFILAAHVRDVALNKIPPDKESSKFGELLSSKHAEDFDLSKYPTILRRYMATFIDGTFVLLAFVLFAYILQGDGDFELAIRIVIGCAILFIYEPLFTSKLCTLGQKVMGIRIRHFSSGHKISIFAAYLRIVVKLLLGIISFFSIPWTRKRRALHDFVAGSVVVYAD